MTKPIRETLEQLLASADKLPAWEWAFVKPAAICEAVSEAQTRVIQRIAKKLDMSAFEGTSGAHR